MTVQNFYAFHIGITFFSLEENLNRKANVLAQKKISSAKKLKHTVASMAYKHARF